MRKCYISGRVGEPMNGQTDGQWEKEYKEKFAKASEYVADVLGMVPVNPTMLPHNHGRTWGDYMKEAIGAMMPCEAIYLIDDWVVSEGARIEKELAEKLGMQLYYPIGWEDLPDIHKFIMLGIGRVTRVPVVNIADSDFFTDSESHMKRVRFAEYRVAFIGKEPYWSFNGVS